MNVVVSLLNGLTYLVTIGVAIAMIPGSPLQKALEKWIERRVTHRFDLALETHRHELALEAERLKAQYQSDLHNYAIVVARRHEVGRELFRRVYEA